MDIIRSKILSQFPHLVFGMSTRDGAEGNKKFHLNMSFNVGDNPNNVEENRKKFFSAMQIDSSTVAFPQQEHTDNVLECLTAAKYLHCDALFTEQKNIFLAVSVADCTPVILFDPKKNVVAGIHAGWRGTMKEIVQSSIKKLKERYAVKPENIFAFVGPSAGACCYEVGEEVAKSFPNECRELQSNGKSLLDVKKANTLQLLANGVQESHIEVHSDCTIHNHHYHSFRRDGNESGRMLAIIGMKQ